MGEEMLWWPDKNNFTAQVFLSITLTWIDPGSAKTGFPQSEEFQETRGGWRHPNLPYQPVTGPSPPELDALSFCLPNSFMSTFQPPHLLLIYFPSLSISASVLELLHCACSFSLILDYNMVSQHGVQGVLGEGQTELFVIRRRRGS
jgi:hypothetical protein